GTIAVTYSSYSRCGGSPQARKMGFDIVFNNPNYSVTLSQPYNKTVCNPVINTYDFEATALHELGHAFNLGHVISPQEQSSNYTNRNPGGVIHPTATLSVARKSLDHHVLDGILYTTTQFGYTDYGACNTDPEVAPLTRNIPANDNCPATFPDSATPEGQSYTIDLVNATSNKLVDPQFRAIGTAGNANGTGVTVTNNVYQAIRTAQGGTLSITISNYSPEADAEACPTTGARVALYQVNSCPAGQNWPAPAYAATFTGNTTLNFNGLPANTNYILFFEGVANTKSTFTATLGNSALPIRIINFSGAIQGKHHLLTLSMGLLQDVSRLELERSADGQQFNRLASFNARGPLEQKLTDASPLPGKNYYRVLVVHANGQVEYSKTIVLQRPDADGFKLLSNPVSNQLQLLLPTGGAHAYTIHLNDMQGRLLLTHTNAGGLVTLPTATLAAGVYQLRVMNKEGKTVFMERVVK
ncbi:MAG TPA: T9SS type A sorting domain-containing protein, partial [Phnomibacter sp.]|nr:T9SS type A sorting domain-containing protein [Phnomibacter sp.]